MNVPGRWLKKTTTWRKISLNTWSTPDNATIYGNLEVEVNALEGFLAQRSQESGVKCTLTHAVTRAVALLLRRYPECNVLVRGRRLWLRDDVDIFHQVAMPTGGKGKADLSGATIRKADTKRIEQIARELREGAEAVRAGRDSEMADTRKLMLRLPNFLVRWSLAFIGWVTYFLNLRMPGTPRDPFGGAMVTSVGMLGIQLAYAPLVTFANCPVLALVGQTEERPVVRDGAVVVRRMCTITATLDHRIIDGYQAGLLASELKRLLEHPELLDEQEPSVKES